MLKLAGVTALLVCGLALGLGAAGTLSRHVRALEAWAAALELLEGELAFRLPTMPELLGSLARRAPLGTRAVFFAVQKGLERLGENSLEEIWTAALAEQGGDLLEEDLELLSRLGPILGQYRWEDQRQGAETVRAELTRRAGQAREELGRKGRAYETLGLALGAFLAILLV